MPGAGEASPPVSLQAGWGRGLSPVGRDRGVWTRDRSQCGCGSHTTGPIWVFPNPRPSDRVGGGIKKQKRNHRAVLLSAWQEGEAAPWWRRSAGGADLQGVQEGNVTSFLTWVRMPPPPTMGAVLVVGVRQCEAEGWELRSNHQGEEN